MYKIVSVSVATFVLNSLSYNNSIILTTATTPKRLSCSWLWFHVHQKVTIFFEIYKENSQKKIINNFLIPKYLK